MKTLMCVMFAAAIVGGTMWVDVAEAGDRDRREWRQRRGDNRDRFDRQARFGRRDRLDRRDRFFGDRDVYVIREYYRPYYRQLPPGLRHRYYRTGYLPPGWARRIRPIPRYIERDLIVIPHGYRRGIIDGHAVVYDRRGFILDIALLF